MEFLRPSLLLLCCLDQPVNRGGGAHGLSRSYSVVSSDALRDCGGVAAAASSQRPGPWWFLAPYGQSGLGKSTLMNTLFKSKVSRRSVLTTTEERIPKTIEIKSISHGGQRSAVSPLELWGAECDGRVPQLPPCDPCGPDSEPRPSASLSCF
ncbi:hypothetical protein JZ751_013284 [Albula glossodonta]|uniref:Septin-type G domain-containing protein n=1 Tax=Albula glossodonta TaxID=121402 RepID=A0A8T2P5G0_9TELE|nr:hypothetical protein JZ751_013284 [Albula glossodonta]